MKIYKCTDSPIRLYGLNVIEPEKGHFWRLSTDIMERCYSIKMPVSCFGGRARFITDSSTIAIRMELKH